MSRAVAMAGHAVELAAFFAVAAGLAVGSLMLR